MKRRAKWTLVLLRCFISLRVLLLLCHEDRNHLEYTSAPVSQLVGAYELRRVSTATATDQYNDVTYSYTTCGSTAWL